MLTKLVLLKQEIVNLQFRLHLGKGSRVNFLYRRLEINQVGLHMYQNLVQHRKSLIKAWVQAPIWLKEWVKTKQLKKM